MALSGNTPTGHTMSLASLSKKIQYLLGSSDGWGIYQVSLAHPMLDLLMGHLGPRRQLRIAVGAADPMAESLPVNIGSSYLGKQVTLYAQWEGAQGGTQSGATYDTAIDYLIPFHRT